VCDDPGSLISNAPGGHMAVDGGASVALQPDRIKYGHVGSGITIILQYCFTNDTQQIILFCKLRKHF
jgi:hypothetical protein